MKLKLNVNKKNIKALSANNSKLPVQVTPNVAGGWYKTYQCTYHCYTQKPHCNTVEPTRQSGCCNSTDC
ncbi:hypothetical protein [Pseudoalteromonas luteoviolacea]|uniref:Uncharacterized protein n=1 Tax=Pseudoalteromonas luteoviolacea H33 TaxID=1365251 RepID=A0A167DW63_9GAMM|nr:hypothetical protein [Pseudoalteromonas luteoviolacea]KZN49447.1 hypothetical protein N476_19365 [Pseudoalteromonas luteoviolacea H33]KZN72620.1 hypothetical protein N477_24815 [Pseudoalteromonas luteoviolacea H33-S]MBQ4876255.1 hypothetical protein [Pseudoalteromonas luteoviolacea]MBQ4906289.1 hypothetical protein [Pseudoalteromonas luteoviolacea]